MSSKEQKTRDNILNATWKLMEASSGQGVRMSDIAKAAGVSRQAVYLHFDSRLDLLKATIAHIDEHLGLVDRFAPVEDAKTSREALDRFVEAWGNYIPEIIGISKALLAVRDTDEAAAIVWDECMSCLRSASHDLITRLSDEGVLNDNWTITAGGEILSTILSIQVWEQFTNDCDWSQQMYIHHISILARQALVQ